MSAFMCEITYSDVWIAIFHHIILLRKDSARLNNSCRSYFRKYGMFILTALGELLDYDRRQFQLYAANRGHGQRQQVVVRVLDVYPLLGQGTETLELVGVCFTGGEGEHHQICLRVLQPLVHHFQLLSLLVVIPASEHNQPLVHRVGRVLELLHPLYQRLVQRPRLAATIAGFSSCVCVLIQLLEDLDLIAQILRVLPLLSKREEDVRIFLEADQRHPVVLPQILVEYLPIISGVRLTTVKYLTTTSLYASMEFEPSTMRTMSRVMSL